MTANSVVAVIQDNKVTYKVHFDVPIELAFEVWTAPEHLSQWWGPDGFTLTTKSMEFKEGGYWEFVMHGPDGHDYKNRVKFVEIRAPRFIAYKHVGDGEGDPDVFFESEIHLEKAGGGTDMTFVQIFPSKAELERVNQKHGAIEGAKQHIGKFGAYALALKEKGGSHA